MDIDVAPLQESEVDTFTKIYWDAFNPIEANMILPMIYPLGLQPDLQERLRNRVLKPLRENASKACFCAKDRSSGEILGVSWWQHVEDPPESRETLDERYDKAKASRSGGVEVEKMNRALEDAFFRAAFYSEAETMGAQSYMTLKMLAIRPERARKGVGTLLLRKGLEEVDRLDLPCFIHAGVQAKPLYERYGFRDVGEMPCNAFDYGGRSDGRHWCLVRTARSQQRSQTGRYNS